MRYPRMTIIPTAAPRTHAEMMNNRRVNASPSFASERFVSQLMCRMSAAAKNLKEDSLGGRTESVSI